MISEEKPRSDRVRAISHRDIREGHSGKEISEKIPE
jgi:hypothetical protein